MFPVSGDWTRFATEVKLLRPGVYRGICMSDIYVYGQRRALPEDAAFESFLDPAQTAVVSIDMHEGHLSEDVD